MSPKRQSDANEQALDLFAQWLRFNDLDALLAAYARGEITDDHIVNEIAVRYQRGIGSAVQALAELNKAAAQQTGERLKQRLDEMLDGLARRSNAPLAARKPTTPETFNDREDNVLLREYVILTALAKSDAELRSAEIFALLRKFDAALDDATVTSHLVRLHKAGIIGKLGKGRYHSSPKGASHLKALLLEVETRGLKLPMVAA